MNESVRNNFQSFEEQVEADKLNPKLAPDNVFVTGVPDVMSNPDKGSITFDRPVRQGKGHVSPLNTPDDYQMQVTGKHLAIIRAEKAEVELLEFMKAVSGMRNSQRLFFETKTKFYLNQSKEREKKIDEYLKSKGVVTVNHTPEKPAQEPEQTKLF